MMDAILPNAITLGGPARWIVTLDRWHPARLNQLLNAHWAARNSLKKQDAIVVALAVQAASVPRAEEPRRVSLELTFAPHHRRGDPDSYWKTTLDSLVQCGALKNDSPRWCELGRVQLLRGKMNRTVILLESLA